MINSTIIHIVPDFLSELKRHYPSGYVLGDAYAIVGQFGLTIQWNNLSGNKSVKIFKENEQLPITEIKKDFFVLGGFVPQLVIHSHHFKGFGKIADRT